MRVTFSLPTTIAIWAATWRLEEVQGFSLSGLVQKKDSILSSPSSLFPKLLLQNPGMKKIEIEPLRFAYELSTQLALSGEPCVELGKDVVLADSPGRGKGVFAVRSIEEGTLLTPYFGPIKHFEDIPEAENNCYMFDLGNGGYVVDGSDPERSSWGRYFNHSRRRQNCHAEYVESSKVLSSLFGQFGGSGFGRNGGEAVTAATATTGIIIRASRRIEVGEELFIDYGDEYWEGLVPNPIARLRIHYG